MFSQRVSENSGNFVASQGILYFAIKNQEKSGNFACGPYRCIFFIIWPIRFKLGKNHKSCPYSNFIRQIFFFLNSICFHFCIMFYTRYRKCAWCWRRSHMLTYFQDHYVEAILMNKVIYLWFEMYYKNHNRVYMETVTGICVCSKRNIREKSGKFFCQPCANRVYTTLKQQIYCVTA